ncbi:MAG: hypothetical protein MUC43_08210 [Pirellula sp.]|nr:hypothetical protein [Pirellula sp.]
MTQHAILVQLQTDHRAALKSLAVAQLVALKSLLAIHVQLLAVTPDVASDAVADCSARSSQRRLAAIPVAQQLAMQCQLLALAAPVDRLQQPLQHQLLLLHLLLQHLLLIHTLT